MLILLWREERSRGNEVKNGEPTAHINTFRRNDLLADETNTMGHKFFLAAREGLYGRMGAIMECWGQGVIWEQNKRVKVMEK